MHPVYNEVLVTVYVDTIKSISEVTLTSTASGRLAGVCSWLPVVFVVQQSSVDVGNA